MGRGVFSRAHIYLLPEGLTNADVRSRLNLIRVSHAFSRRTFLRLPILPLLGRSRSLLLSC